ncbi:DUF2812 domain-containing protein [Streptococcus ovis]|uniref:DUF2812 domain-containing protein n=1 Tax=Streptococcus ovis TaxID=82806 RepID=UPI00036036B3|nr:DUF2812 domain-containing protein [Streptococcus ovis]
MKTKVVFKLFLITDFEKIEAYLADMHKKGWKLTEVKWGVFYHFEACDPADVVYKIDFKPMKKEESVSYVQFYQDYDWELVNTCRSFRLFRKNAVDGEDVEIFSDNASKLEMIGRIFKRRFLFSMFLYLYLIVLQDENTTFRIGVSLIYLPLLLYLAYRFYQLRKQLK